MGGGVSPNKPQASERDGGQAGGEADRLWNVPGRRRVLGSGHAFPGLPQGATFPLSTAEGSVLSHLHLPSEAPQGGEGLEARLPQTPSGVSEAPKEKREGQMLEDLLQMRVPSR